VAAASVIGAPAATAAPNWPAPQPYPATGSDASETLSSLPEGSEYVALGDSYGAGYGLGSPTRLPTGACGQSGEDYPHRVANRFGLALTDVTCAGATTDDVLTRHQWHGVPPQIDALSDTTKLVTITIGGNDADLFGTASSCLALSSGGPVFSGRDAPSCRSTLVHDGTDTLARKVSGQTAGALDRTLRAVRAAAPNAVVVMVGYPAIFPDAEHTPDRGCFRSALDLGSLAGSFPRNAFPFTDKDVAYLSGVQASLDRVGRAAAEANGVRFVDVYSTTQGHSACATGKPYVNGVTLDATSNLRRIDLEPGALHPNRRGAAYLADRTADELVDLAG
jgi:lysophospholipase L1-like esterase